MIYGSTANEGGAFQPYPVDNPQGGVNQSAANLATESILCGAADTSILRNSIGLTTYRYQYAGNWTNQVRIYGQKRPQVLNTDHTCLGSVAVDGGLPFVRPCHVVRLISRR